MASRAEAADSKDVIARKCEALFSMPVLLSNEIVRFSVASSPLIVVKIMSCGVQTRFGMAHLKIKYKPFGHFKFLRNFKRDLDILQSRRELEKRYLGRMRRDHTVLTKRRFNDLRLQTL